MTIIIIIIITIMIIIIIITLRRNKEEEHITQILGVTVQGLFLYWHRHSQTSLTQTNVSENSWGRRLHTCPWRNAGSQRPRASARPRSQRWRWRRSCSTWALSPETETEINQKFHKAISSKMMLQRNVALYHFHLSRQSEDICEFEEERKHRKLI